MTSTTDTLKASLEAKFREKYSSKAGDKNTEKTAKPTKKPKLFETSTPDTTEMVELWALMQDHVPDDYDMPEDMKDKYFFDKNIIRNTTDWNEEVRGYIPEPFFHIPDPHYSNTILTAIEQNEIFKAVGHPGSGKDTEVRWWCAILKWPYIRRDGAEGKEPADELGFPVPDGKGGMTFADGPLTTFVRHGGFYIHSEPDVNPASVNMALQSLKEPERMLNLMGHPDAHQAQIKAHPDFRYSETSNSRGTGDNLDKYAATGVQDQSSLNRVSFFYMKDYLNPDMEALMVKSVYPDLTDRYVGKMVQLANLIRKGWEQGNIELPYSPRNMMKWAKLSVRYGEPVESFRMTYFNALNDAEKKLVRDMWEGVKFDEFKL